MMCSMRGHCFKCHCLGAGAYFFVNPPPPIACNMVQNLVKSQKDRKGDADGEKRIYHED